MINKNYIYFAQGTLCEVKNTYFLAKFEYSSFLAVFSKKL